MNIGSKENIDKITRRLNFNLILRVFSAREKENIVRLDIMHLIVKINRGIAILKKNKLIPIKRIFILNGFV